MEEENKDKETEFVKNQMKALVACESDLMDYSAKLAEKYGTQVMVTSMTKVIIMVLIMIRQHEMGKELAEALEAQLAKLVESHDENDAEKQVRQDFVDIFKGGA